MGIIIQKFGGTSLANTESRLMALAKITEATEKGDRVVLVVSAMGRLGSPYATDTLLGLVGYKESVLSNQELDMLISTGEVISSVVMSNLLNSHGIKAQALTGGGAGVMTDDNHLSADIIRIDTDAVRDLISKGIVPVIAGFQGRGPHNEVTTIGRGGSDTTAALFGEALKADRVEIYTDVDGIMTADPRIYGAAKIIDQVSYTEVFQMADSGAKVIHPRAVEIAMRAGIKMLIKNTFNDHVGTSIIHYEHIDQKYKITEKLITSIAHRINRLQVHVEGPMDDEIFFAKLAEEGISIDIINIFPERRVFTIDQDKKEKLIDVIKVHPVSHHFIDDCCKITVIGERMTGVPGVMAKIIKSLSSKDIEILQTADSLSTIACLIRCKDLENAILALHQTFELD